MRCCRKVQEGPARFGEETVGRIHAAILANIAEMPNQVPPGGDGTVALLPAAFL